MMLDTEGLDLDVSLSDDEDESEQKDSKQNNNNKELTMRCAEITVAGKPLKITCRTRPEVPEEGVLIKTLYGGMCHSDVHFIDDEQDLGQGRTFKYSDILGEDFTGLVPGHEICGTVEDIGKQVSPQNSIKVGDTVIIYPWKGCRQCEACTERNGNLCENNQSGTTDIGQGTYSGGYGSYVAVPEIELCVKLPKVIKPEIGCMLPCSALTAYSALTKAKSTLDAAIRLRGVANLLIIGLGGVGMWAIIIVKYVFCDKNVKVICADTNKEKLDTVAKLGADDVTEWDISKDTTELVSSTTVNGYNKIDVAIDFVGTAKTVEIAFDSLHYGGSIIVVGLHGGCFNVSLPLLTSKSVSLQGVRTGTLGSLKQLVDLLAVQNLQTFPPLEIITLDQVNDILERLRKGEVKGRAVIKHCE